MKKAFLAGAITLLLATGAAHAETRAAKAELPNHMIGSWCVEEDDESGDQDEYELLKLHGQCRKDNGGTETSQGIYN
jgi:hypothetical protein